MNNVVLVMVVAALLVIFGLGVGVGVAISSGDETPKVFRERGVACVHTSQWGHCFQDRR